MGEFTMPSMGSDMEAGTLVEWLVHPGDRVKRGDVVAVVETRKGAIEIEVFEEGVVRELVVAEGTNVPVGTVLARIDAAAAAPAPVAAVVPPAAPPPAAAPTAPPPVAAVVPPAAPPPTAPAPPPAAPAPRSSALAPPPDTSGWVRSSPAARRRAEELGVDLHAVHGTGPHGAVQRADVEAASRAALEEGAPVESPAPPVPPVPATVASPMRHAIAAAMSRSNREIPHYYLSHTIDLKRALDWLAERNRERPITERMVPGVLLLRAVALALRKYPELNGFWVDDAFRPGTGIHPGLAISLRKGGLVIPAVHEADRIGLDELTTAMGDVVQRARAGRLRSSDLADGTITITSLGDQGVEAVFGVIYPPQVAIVGFGRVVERPWAVDGMLAVRPVVHATFAGDHRANDAHTGGLFLALVDRLLQEPEKL